MANNIDVTPGVGKTVASEEISSTQYQKIKLVDSTAASTTGTGIAANPLQVSLANTGTNATLVSVNQAQVAGTTVDTNSGTKSAGTQRIVLATDQPTMTNAQPVTLTSTTITGTVVVDDLAAAPTGAAAPANAQFQGNLAQSVLPGAATPGNLVGQLGDLFGRSITAGSLRGLKGEQVTTITSSTAETTIVTQVASTFIDVYGLIMTNSSASATKVTVRDATAGGTARIYYVPAGDMRGFMLPESGAVKQGTVNNNWTATCGTSVASLDVQVLYVLNK